MFPDPSIHWSPYPSIIDGINAPPFVFSHGLWRGVLHLIVLEAKLGIRAYGIQLRCEAYFGVEEMIYSIANHSASGGHYNGTVYVKEADHSHLLETYARTHPVKREVRHFSFVGGDYCYEALAIGEPIIRTFV